MFLRLVFSLLFTPVIVLADGVQQDFSTCTDDRVLEQSPDMQPWAYVNGQGQIWVRPDEGVSEMYRAEVTSTQLDGINQHFEARWPAGEAGPHMTMRLALVQNVNGMPISLRNTFRNPNGQNSDELYRYGYDSETGRCHVTQVVAFDEDGRGFTTYDRELCRRVLPQLRSLSFEQLAACTSSLSQIATAYRQRNEELDHRFGAVVPANRRNPYGPTQPTGIRDPNDLFAAASILNTCKSFTDTEAAAATADSDPVQRTE